MEYKHVELAVPLANFLRTTQDRSAPPSSITHARFCERLMQKGGGSSAQRFPCFFLTKLALIVVVIPAT